MGREASVGWTSTQAYSLNLFCVYTKENIFNAFLSYEKWYICSHKSNLHSQAEKLPCVCVLSISHYVRALSAISHCFVNKRIQHFLLSISLSEQMMPEIFILFFNGIPMASAANQVEILAYQVGKN